MAISSSISTSTRTPLFYAELDNSMANTSTGSNKSLLIGIMSSAGTAKENAPILINTSAAAKTKFGCGSQLALMVDAYRDQDPNGELYCVAQKLTSAQSTGTVTIVGTALESGTIAFYVGSTKVAVDVAAGDAPATIATALATAVNKLPDLPVSAAVNESVSTQVDITCKCGGAYGDDIPLGLNLQGDIGGESDINGVTVEIVPMDNGAGALKLADAFACLGDEAYMFVGIAENDATALDAVQTEFNDDSGRWSPSKMQYGHVFTAKRGTDEDLVAFGKTRNNQHTTVFGIEPKMADPAFIVAAAATGREAYYINSDPARPTQTGPLVNLMAPAVEDRFNKTTRESLLHNGIATLYVNGGYVRIERPITTYQMNAFGAEDNSYLDSETLFTNAKIITTLQTAVTSKYARHKLASDGTRFGAGQAIVTPSIIRAEFIAQYAAMETLGLVENATLFAENLIVERNATDPNRVDVLFPPDLVNQLRVFTVKNQFRLQYPTTAE